MAEEVVPPPSSLQVCVRWLSVAIADLSLRTRALDVLNDEDNHDNDNNDDNDVAIPGCSQLAVPFR
jgi:hypothetical protein